MPPNRSEFWQELASQEGKIILALESVPKGQIKSLHAAAKLYDIPFSTLQMRATGVSSRVDTRANGYKLTQLEEDSLVE